MLKCSVYYCLVLLCMLHTAVSGVRTAYKTVSTGVSIITVRSCGPLIVAVSELHTQLPGVRVTDKMTSMAVSINTVWRAADRCLATAHTAASIKDSTKDSVGYHCKHIHAHTATPSLVLPAWRVA